MASPWVRDKMRRVTRGESQGQGEDEEEAGGMLQMLQIYVGDTQNGKHLEVWRNNRHRFISPQSERSEGFLAFDNE